MTNFAQGKYAIGYCDRCDFEFPLGMLRDETYAGLPRHVRVCPTCRDLDNPQLLLGRFPVNDPQAIRNPRPDPSLAESRRLFGWQPVGNPLTGTLYGHVGTVTVET